MKKNLFSIPRFKANQTFKRIRIWLVLLNVFLFIGSIVVGVFGMKIDETFSFQIGWLGIVAFILAILFMFSMIATFFITIKYSKRFS